MSPPGNAKGNIPPRFVQSLITYAQTVSEQEIRDDYEALYARMKAGEGKTLIQSAPGGKTFMFQVTASVEEMFAAYGEALRELNDDESSKIVATYADFSCLQR